MKIGIIGAGNIGATLARKLAASGHEVKLANSKGPDTIRDLARDLGAVAASKEQAVRDVDGLCCTDRLVDVLSPPEAFA